MPASRIVPAKPPSPPRHARRRLLAGSSLLTAGLLHPAIVRAQPAAFPAKPVRLVVPYPPGGATDLVGRLLAAKLGETWKQPVVVDNKAGASGMIGTTEVARAPADGHTILVAITTHIQNPSIYAKVPFDPIGDFQPISQICLSYLVLCVLPDFPAKDLKGLVATVKATPGKYAFGSFGTGSSSHIVGESFSRVAGLDLAHVPYKGAAPLVTDLLGGQVPMAWIDVSTATQHLKAGKLRPLAVTGARRAPMLPDVATLAELGYRGFEPLGWVGVLVPAATPKAVVETIAGEIQRVVALPDVQQKLNDQTLVPVGNSPQAFAQVLKDDAATWAAMVKAAGIQPQ